MAPRTPSSEDSPASASGLGQQHEDKIRRNVACVNCRNSKVRCRTNATAGKPCQRCAKLQVECIYDKSHKRVTKRSKLELIEQELKTIKEAVHPRNNGDASCSPSKPLANNTLFPSQPTPNGAGVPPAITPSINLLEPPKPPPPPPRFAKIGPTKSRLLGDRLISGEDVNWYFNKFLEHFHSYVPVLRKRDPDECHQANPTLFWTIVYVASRRYARDDYTFNALVEKLNRDIWTSLATPNLDLEAIHAIMLVCAWPFPTIRFVSDPSNTLINVALSACMLLGLHDGVGSHSKFLVGGRIHFHSTDLEASATWISCCILAQRISAYNGIPPPFLQDNDKCIRAAKDALSPELMTLFELQRFCNKLHTAMAGHIAAHDGVFESVVKSWEDDFETRKPFITRVDTDCSRFFLLAAQLEVQSYYFVIPPSSPPPTPITIHRVYTTAHTLITAALSLETSSKLLSHGPNWIYRSIVDAACILVSTLHSHTSPATAEVADEILRQTRAAVGCCSVTGADLLYRCAVLMDTFWSVRHLLSKFDDARRAWPARGGAAVTFWCMHTFKDALQEAKKSTEEANKGLEAFQGASTRSNTVPDQHLVGFQDRFPDVDWSSFLDDFGWLGDATVFLGPPQC